MSPPARRTRPPASNSTTRARRQRSGDQLLEVLLNPTVTEAVLKGKELPEQQKAMLLYGMTQPSSTTIKMDGDVMTLVGSGSNMVCRKAEKAPMKRLALGLALAALTACASTPPKPPTPAEMLTAAPWTCESAIGPGKIKSTQTYKPDGTAAFDLSITGEGQGMKVDAAGTGTGHVEAAGGRHQDGSHARRPHRHARQPQRHEHRSRARPVDDRPVHRRPVRHLSPSP